MLKHLRHLNGWQRIGVLLSVSWLVCGAVWGYNIGLKKTIPITASVDMVVLEQYLASLEQQRNGQQAHAPAGPAPSQETLTAEEYAKALRQAARTGAVPAQIKDYEPKKQSADLSKFDYIHYAQNSPLITDWASTPDYPARWYLAAFYGVVPIPIGWLVVYGLIALVRWIMNGFKEPKGEPPGLNLE